MLKKYNFSQTYLAVHLVIVVWFGVIKTSIAFLIDEKVGEIYFFKLQLDGLNKLFRDKTGCFFSQLHSLGHRIDPKLYHNGIGVTIDDLLN